MQHLRVVVCFGVLAMSFSYTEGVHRWGLKEIALESNRDHGVRAQDVGVEVAFSHPEAGRCVRQGFWDGGRTWRVRFSPPVVGDWQWRSRCPDDPSLDGREGAFTCAPYAGDNPFYRHGPLSVSNSGHHFVHADGTPFFWLVDTVWNGALKSTPTDWGLFLDDRVSKRFTGVQYVVTQWRTAYANAEGEVAYTGEKDIRINPAFFRRIDARTKAVNEKGLLAVPVLLWTLGKRQHNPGQLPEDQAVRLARYMTARLGGWHVAWFLPGDGNYQGKNADRWKRIGRAVFDGRDHAPVTLHPQGMHWPWDAFCDEAWIGYFGYQSGHGDDARTLKWIHGGPPSQKWQQKPSRPVINLEPPYEDHIAYQSRKPHTAYSVRRAVYWSLLNAPTAGSSYGAHGVWSWEQTAGTPQEHGGSGVAKPWFEAMRLPGSTHMKHMAELFASLRWWELVPAPDLILAGGQPAVSSGLTHLAYTRTPGGNASLFVNGERIGETNVPGKITNWDAECRFMLANELTRDRAWLGELHRVAVYDQVLDANAVRRRYGQGAKQDPGGAVVLYTFGEGEGDAVRDVSRNGTPLDLKIDKSDAVQWIPGGGLRVTDSVLIASASSAAKVTEAVARTQAVTVEVWCKPANRTQDGPARIVSFSRDTSRRSFTLGQKGPHYEMRLRTTKTSENGIPALSDEREAVAETGHISASRSMSGDLAVVYLATGGGVALKPGVLKDGLRAEWFNPRTGERRAAHARANGTYASPDRQDWVWLMR